MPLLKYADQTIAIDSNKWAALIQQVALARFAENEGFFLTVLGEGNEPGEKAKTSWWLSPATSFIIEFEDEPTEDLPVSLIEEWIEISRGNHGMILGSIDDWPYKLVDDRSSTTS